MSNKNAQLLIGCCGRLTFDCGERVSVEYTEKNEAYEIWPQIFTTYLIEKGLINGHNHYTSDDGNLALVYCSGKWIIPPNQDRYIAKNLLQF